MSHIVPSQGSVWTSVNNGGVWPTSTPPTLQIKSKTIISPPTEEIQWSTTWNVPKLPKKESKVENVEDDTSAQPKSTKQDKQEKQQKDPKINIEDELSKQSLYKTELCRSFVETGICRYGHKCQFAHGEHELRPILRHPKYKTETCKRFATTGDCPYGPRCRFIHPGAMQANINPGIPLTSTLIKQQQIQQQQTQTQPQSQQITKQAQVPVVLTTPPSAVAASTSPIFQEVQWSSSWSSFVAPAATSFPDLKELQACLSDSDPSSLIGDDSVDSSDEEAQTPEAAQSTGTPNSPASRKDSGDTSGRRLAIFQRLTT